MRKLFIPYQLAVIAREKGFSEPCIMFYADSDEEDGVEQLSPLVSEDGILDGIAIPKSSGLIMAPMYQQIVDWFRENHNIEISSPLKRQKDLGPFYGGAIYTINKYFGKSYGSNFKTYYEALNKAIEEAFKLI